MNSKEKYNIQVRIWINKNNKPFLGIGRILLLENIKKHNSIRAAAKEMKMSYRQAWQLVKEMNALSDKKLIEKRIGGKNGGGTYLTKRGEEIIKQFYALNEEIKTFTKTFQQKFDF